MKFNLLFVVISLISSLANAYQYRCVSSGNKNLPDGTYKLIVDGNFSLLTHVATKKWIKALYSPYNYTFVTPDENGRNLFSKRHQGYMGLKTRGKAKIEWGVMYRISQGVYQGNSLDCSRVK